MLLKLLYCVTISLVVMHSTNCMNDCDKQLFQAAFENNVELAQEALDNGAYIDRQDNEEYGLKVYHADIHPPSAEGSTPLYYALMMGNNKAAQFLLDQGANACILNNRGMHALHFAIQPGDITIIKAILDKYPSIINEQGKLVLPLTLAVFSEDIRIIEELLSRGADPFLKNSGIELDDRIKIVGNNTLEALESYFYTLSIVFDPVGKVLDEINIIVKRRDIVQTYPLLLQQAKVCPTKEVLKQAIVNNYPTIVEALVKAGYKVDEADLALAKEFDRKEIGRMLIKALYMASEPIAKQFYAQLPENVQRSIAAFTIVNNYASIY